MKSHGGFILDSFLTSLFTSYPSSTSVHFVSKFISKPYTSFPVNGQAQATMAPTFNGPFPFYSQQLQFIFSQNRLRDPDENVIRSQHCSTSDLSKASHHPYKLLLWSDGPHFVWPLAHAQLRLFLFFPFLTVDHHTSLLSIPEGLLPPVLCAYYFFPLECSV